MGDNSKQRPLKVSSRSLIFSFNGDCRNPIGSAGDIRFSRVVADLVPARVPTERGDLSREDRRIAENAEEARGIRYGNKETLL